MQSIGAGLNLDCKWNFKRIVVEIFTRKIKPFHPKSTTLEMEKYITRETAQMDISEQRSKGVKGVQYAIIPKLINLKEEKYEERYALRDANFNMFVGNPSRYYAYKKRKRLMPCKPQWSYKFLSVKKS